MSFSKYNIDTEKNSFMYTIGGYRIIIERILLRRTMYDYTMDPFISNKSIPMYS